MKVSGREGGREGGRERGREGGREGRRGGGRERERRGEREREGECKHNPTYRKRKLNTNISYIHVISRVLGPLGVIN